MENVKKTKNCGMRKTKDGVEEVEEAELVNKHIFWRSAGCVGRQGYEFMTAYDTIVSMGAESMHVPRHSRLHGVRDGGGREWGHQ